MALLVQKLWRKKNCQNLFPAILRRKPKAKSQGWVGGLSGFPPTNESLRLFMGWTKLEDLFSWGLPLILTLIAALENPSQQISNF